MTETTAARARNWLGLMPLAIAVVLAIVGLPFMIASAPGHVRRAGAAHLHGFDGAMFAAQPLPMQLHIIAISLAVPLGVVMMLSRKGRRFHRVAGWTWAGLVTFGAVTPVWLALSDRHWYPIHLIVIFVMTLLITGVWAARRHKVALHRHLMIWLYFGSILGAGALTFMPGRLMWRLFFG
jgi:uncharacterized membrane protein